MNVNTNGCVENKLSTIFFSQENIQKLQDAIQAGMYHKLNGQYTIGLEDYNNLNTVMTRIFLQHSTNKTTNIKFQVSELNKMVLNFCLQDVFSE